MKYNPYHLQGEDAPECFGECREDAPKCATCQFLESCRYYRDNPPPRDPNARHSSGHHVSIDQYGYSEDLGEEIKIPAEVAEEENADDTPITREDLKTLLHFMVYAVDDYTMALIIEMLRGGHRDTVSLAKAFGVSKQAIHQVIGRIADRYPDLSGLIELAVRRCAGLANPEGRSNGGRNPHRRENGNHANHKKGEKATGSMPETPMLPFH